MKAWGIHACTPWSGDCSMRGIRLNIRTPRAFIYLALTPEGRVEHNGRWRWLVINKKEATDG